MSDVRIPQDDVTLVDWLCLAAGHTVCTAGPSQHRPEDSRAGAQDTESTRVCCSPGYREYSGMLEPRIQRVLGYVGVKDTESTRVCRSQGYREYSGM